MAEHNARSDRDLVWVVQGASALSLGTLAGLLYSVRSVTPTIRIEFSGATVIAFALAALASFAFWHLVFRLSAADSAAENTEHRAMATRKRWLALLASVLALGLVLAFVYPLKDFSHEKFSEISVGALIALGFLSVLGLLFWRVVRYLEGVK
jgi:hypothetical protein